MAKAVVPLAAFEKKFGSLDKSMTARLHRLVTDFLHETGHRDHRPREARHDTRHDTEEAKVR